MITMRQEDFASFEDYIKKMTADGWVLRSKQIIIDGNGRCEVVWQKPAQHKEG